MSLRKQLLILIFISLNSLICCYTEDELRKCSNNTKVFLSYFLNATPLPNEYQYVKRFPVYSGDNINELGNYEDCNRIPEGKYYIMNHNDPLNISVGFCYFKECNQDILNTLKENMTVILSKIIKIEINSSQINFLDPDLKAQEMRHRYLPSFIFALIFCIIILMMNVLNIIFYKDKKKNNTLKINNESVSSDQETVKSIENKFMDMGSNQSILVSPQSRFMKLLSFFDFSNNFKKIVIVNEEKNENLKLRVLDGMRTMSMSVVVIAHAFFVLLNLKLKNPLELPELLKTMNATVLNSFAYSVDVFFFLSSFLFTVNIQKYLNKRITKIKTICFAIVMRYLRLLPMLVFAIFIFINLVPFFSSGPIYYTIETEIKQCHKYWWTNLLYINNFVDPMNICLGVSWYLSNDFQFFIYSIVIYITFNNSKLIRDIIFCSTFVFSLIIQFILVMAYQIKFMKLDDYETLWNVYYVKPWCRITPYILGIYFAELYLNLPKNEENIDKTTPYYVEWMNNLNLKLKNSRDHSLILLAIGLLCCLYGFFINYFAIRNDCSIFVGAIQYMFNKTIFTFGIACLLHLTFLDKLSILKEFLSLKIFTIIGRFSFLIYLIHLTIIRVVLYSYPSNIYVQFSDILFSGIGFLFFMIPLGLILKM